MVARPRTMVGQSKIKKLVRISINSKMGFRCAAGIIMQTNSAYDHNRVYDTRITATSLLIATSQPNMCQWTAMNGLAVTTLKPPAAYTRQLLKYRMVLYLTNKNDLNACTKACCLKKNLTNYFTTINSRGNYSFILLLIRRI